MHLRTAHSYLFHFSGHPKNSLTDYREGILKYQGDHGDKMLTSLPELYQVSLQHGISNGKVTDENSENQGTQS